MKGWRNIVPLTTRMYKAKEIRHTGRPRKRCKPYPAIVSGTRNEVDDDDDDDEKQT